MEHPHKFFEITTRTILSKFLLKPSPKLNDLILGVFGRALANFPKVRLYLFKIISNHYHAIVSADNCVQLSAFIGHINGNIAREAGRFYGWRAKFWSRRFSQIGFQDHESLLKSIRYIISHGCKENLVESPEKWPGVGCEQALTGGKQLEGTWYDRSAFYEAERKGKEVRLRDFAIRYPVPLTTFPFLADKTEEQRRTYFRKLIKDIREETYQRLRDENKGVLGKEAVLAQDPFDEPLNTKRTYAPRCHAASAAARRAYLNSYRAFVNAYRWAAEKLKRGDLDVKFPENCFPPRLAACLPTVG